jgi:capsular polysaccharide biosynthesis protein
LSRRNYRPHRHRVDNEEEIAALLVERGFEVVAPETLSFIETIELFRTTRLFVSPCGAQNVNMCFSQPGTVYLELGAAHHKNERSWFINDCLGAYGGVTYVRHYGETVYVAPGGADNNWLSRHPIPELAQMLRQAAGEDVRVY